MGSVVSTDDLADAARGRQRVVPVLAIAWLEPDQLGKARPEALLQRRGGEKPAIGGRVDLKARRAAVAGDQQ